MTAITSFKVMGALAKPHRRHLYQLLVNEMGVAHWKVSAGYGVLQAAVGVGALMVSAYGVLVLLAYLCICAAAFLGIATRVRLRVDALVSHGAHTLEAVVSITEGRNKRTPQVGRQEQIHEIPAPPGRGRVQEDQEIADRKTASL